MLVVASKAGGEGLLEDKTEESHSTIEVTLRPPAVLQAVVLPLPASLILLLEVVLGWWYVVVVGLPASVAPASLVEAMRPEAILIIIPGTSSMLSLFSS